MDLTLLTPPSEEEVLALVSLAQMKENLRISHAIEDDFIKRCVHQAYAFLDGRYGWLNRAILTQTWRLRIPGFARREFYTNDNGKPDHRWVPTSIIEIPLPPLQSVTSVKYYADDAQETLTPADYYHVSTDGLFGRIQLRKDVRWPVGLDTRPDAVEIEFVAGFGDAAAVLQKARGLERAITLLASDYFRNREDTYAEPRLVAVNRKIVNGLEKTAGRYRIKNDYA